MQSNNAVSAAIEMQGEFNSGFDVDMNKEKS